MLYGRIIALLPHEVVPSRHSAARRDSPLDLSRPPDVPDAKSKTLDSLAAALASYPAFAGSTYQVFVAATRVRWGQDKWVLARWFPDASPAAIEWFNTLVADLPSNLDAVRRTIDCVLSAALHSEIMEPWKEFKRTVPWTLEFLVALGVASDHQLALLHSRFHSDIAYAEIRSLRARLQDAVNLLCCAVREAAFEDTWPQQRLKLLPRNQHLAAKWLLLRGAPLGRRVMWIMGWHPSPLEEEALDGVAPTATEYTSLVGKSKVPIHVT